MADAGLPTLTAHHVGIVVTDLEAAMNACIRDFGYSFYQFEVNDGTASLPGSSPTFSLRFGLGQLGVTLIELIQPVSGATIYSKRLADCGPGLHHLAFSTTDLAAARKGFAANGYTSLQNGSIRGLVDFSYYEAQELGCIVDPLQLSCDLAGFLLQNAKPYRQTSA
jgi:hypothetical protein